MSAPPARPPPDARAVPGGCRTMVVTEQCLLSHTRNPHLDREGIERELKVSITTARLFMHTHIFTAAPKYFRFSMHNNIFTCFLNPYLGRAVSAWPEEDHLAVARNLRRRRRGERARGQLLLLRLPRQGHARVDRRRDGPPGAHPPTTPVFCRWDNAVRQMNEENNCIGVQGSGFNPLGFRFSPHLNPNSNP